MTDPTLDQALESLAQFAGPSIGGWSLDGEPFDLGLAVSVVHDHVADAARETTRLRGVIEEREAERLEAIRGTHEREDLERREVQLAAGQLRAKRWRDQCPVTAEHVKTAGLTYDHLDAFTSVHRFEKMAAPIRSDGRARGADVIAELVRARRALACKGFAWMPGMRDLVDGDRLMDIGHGRVGDGPMVPRWRWADGGWAEMNEGHEWRPDLDDPATQGCFEHGLIPAAWGPTTSVKVDVDTTATGGWCCHVEVWTGNLGDPIRKFEAVAQDRAEATADALLAALEAAARLEVPT